MDNAVQDPTSQVSAIEQCLSGAKRPIGPFLGAGCPTAIHLEDQSPLIPHVNGETRLVGQRVVALPQQLLDQHLDLTPDPFIQVLLMDS